jgi:hypothetical protein
MIVQAKRREEALRSVNRPAFARQNAAYRPA